MKKKCEMKPLEMNAGRDRVTSNVDKCKSAHSLH